MKTIKPLKPHSKIPDLDSLTYPVLASPKLDGIRCVIVDGKALSYNQKPIPNKFIRETLEELCGHLCLDGELMVDGDFNEVQSVIMSKYHHNQDKFFFNVFDNYSQPDKAFTQRFYDSCIQVKSIDSRHVRIVDHMIVHDSNELVNYWENQLKLGYEGAIVRNPNGRYKFGRSTIKEGLAFKLKKFNDDEAVIVGIEELMHNMDTSSHKVENLYGGDTLGSLVVMWGAKEFKIGSGFDHAERKRLWDQRHELIGKTVTFKYQELSTYGVPRFPVYKGIRYD